MRKGADRRMEQPIDRKGHAMQPGRATGIRRNKWSLLLKLVTVAGELAAVVCWSMVSPGI